MAIKHFLAGALALLGQHAKIAHGETIFNCFEGKGGAVNPIDAMRLAAITVAGRTSCDGRIKLPAKSGFQTAAKTYHSTLLNKGSDDADSSTVDVLNAFGDLAFDQCPDAGGSFFIDGDNRTTGVMYYEGGLNGRHVDSQRPAVLGRANHALVAKEAGNLSLRDFGDFIEDVADGFGDAEQGTEFFGKVVDWIGSILSRSLYRGPDPDATLGPASPRPGFTFDASDNSMNKRQVARGQHTKAQVSGGQFSPDTCDLGVPQGGCSTLCTAANDPIDEANGFRVYRVEGGIDMVPAMDTLPPGAVPGLVDRVMSRIQTKPQGSGLTEAVVGASIVLGLSAVVDAQNWADAADRATMETLGSWFLHIAQDMTGNRFSEASYYIADEDDNLFMTIIAFARFKEGLEDDY